ncbi:hypothetical protein K501DRAFT_329235 [Backusella circina FSU 941]|nr:hypothetical protein K501DRAFT_329235 [Backusella circina FSU 941]
MKLPTEILFFIFRYLNRNDLLATETVCWSWYKAAKVILYENVRLSDIKIARFLQLESSLQMELGSLMKRMYFSSTGSLSLDLFSQFANSTPNIQEFDSGSMHAAKYLILHENQWKYLSRLSYRMKDYEVCAHKFRYSLEELNLLNDVYSNQQALARYLKDFTRLRIVNVASSSSSSILVCDPLIEFCPKLKELNLSLRPLMEKDTVPNLNTIVPCTSPMDRVALDLDRYCPESINFFIRKFPHIKKLALSSEFYEWTDVTFQTLNHLFPYISLSDSSLCLFKSRYGNYGFLYTLGNYGSLLSRKRGKQFQQNYTLITTSYHFPFSFNLDTNEQKCNTKIYYPCNAATFDRFEYTNECIKALGPNADSLTIQSYYHADYNSTVTSSIIDDVIDNCKKLTHLVLLYEKRTILPLQRVSYSITRLVLRECRLSMAFFKSLSECLPYLDRLELIDCVYVSEDPSENTRDNIVLNLAHTHLHTLKLSDKILNLVVISTGSKTIRLTIGNDTCSMERKLDYKCDIKSTGCITVNCKSLKYLDTAESGYFVNMDTEDAMMI